MVLSLIGGIFILLGGAFIAFVGSIFSGLGGLSGAGVGGAVTAVGIVGIIFGIIIILGGIMINSNPKSHTMWGVIIIILSILSWITAAGGFVIGFILALIGGILAITFKPPMMQPTVGTGMMPGAGTPTGSSAMIRCVSCGAMAPAGTMKCPSCGANL